MVVGGRRRSRSRATSCYFSLQALWKYADLIEVIYILFCSNQVLDTYEFGGVGVMDSTR